MVWACSAIPRHFQKFIDLEKNVLVEIEDNQAQLAVGIIYKKDYELSNMSSQFIETTLWHHF